MGVISFVALCGNFPFDDEAEFDPDDLEDPDFLFGDYLWSTVSEDGNTKFNIFKKIN